MLSVTAQYGEWSGQPDGWLMPTAKAALVMFFFTLSVSQVHAQSAAREKLSDDPTKIVTKAGFRYSDFGTVFGSIAFGPVTKINVSLSEDDQWRIGGSYLFDFGIVNFSASEQELDGNITQTVYAIGTFVPLVAFGIEPRGWLLFPAAGANYTEGSIESIDFDFGDDFSFETSSKGGYVGILGLKPLSEKWVLKAGSVVSAGSDDYSGYSIGGGMTFNASPADSISVFGSYIDNSFGQRELLGISYTREF